MTEPVFDSTASDPVDEYGLGADNTQETEQPVDAPEPEDLAHGLGSREPESAPSDAGENDLRFGLGAANTQDTAPVPEEPQPPEHGLGS